MDSMSLFSDRVTYISYLISTGMINAPYLTFTGLINAPYLTRDGWVNSFYSMTLQTYKSLFLFEITLFIK